MKKITLLLIFSLLLIATSQAQRTKFFTQVGTSDVGFDQWYQTDGDFTLGMLFPLSKSVSFGPVITFMPNVNYYVFDYKNGADVTTGSRIGAVLRYNVVKMPKFEMYLQNMASYLKVSYSGLSGVNFPESGSASSLLASFGTGFVYKVSPG
ncbi:MAG: hypothetical protein ACKO3B_13060, partial [Bacteroidota bacterium]